MDRTKQIEGQMKATITHARAMLDAAKSANRNLSTEEDWNSPTALSRSAGRFRRGQDATCLCHETDEVVAVTRLAREAVG